MKTPDYTQRGPAFEAHFFVMPGAKNEDKKDAVLSRSGLFEVVWIKNGKGSCRVDMQKFPIVNGTLYCLFPGQLHLLDSDDDVTGYRIAYSHDFLSSNSGSANSSFFSRYWLSESSVAVMRCDGDVRNEIERIVKEIIWEYNNDHHLKDKMLKGLMHVFIAYLSSHPALLSGPAAQPGTQLIFENFIGLVEKKFSTHKLVSQYADELAVTPNYLSEVVKRSSGFSASHYISRRVILEAKRLALISDFSMKEIAFRVGIEDSCQFSKFFKLNTGATFSEFRKSQFCN